MKINNNFDKRQIELLKEANIDIEKEYNKETLEEIEDIVCNKMLDYLTPNQDFTPLAEEYEKILDIIVDIENDLNS